MPKCMHPSMGGKYHGILCSQHQPWFLPGHLINPLQSMATLGPLLFPQAPRFQKTAAPRAPARSSWGPTDSFLPLLPPIQCIFSSCQLYLPKGSLSNLTLPPQCHSGPGLCATYEHSTSSPLMLVLQLTPPAPWRRLQTTAGRNVSAQPSLPTTPCPKPPQQHPPRPCEQHPYPSVPFRLISR